MTTEITWAKINWNELIFAVKRNAPGALLAANRRIASMPEATITAEMVAKMKDELAAAVSACTAKGEA